MGLATKQREELIKERGEPVLQLEFDVFEGNRVSMWTHFKHGEDFQEVKKRLLAIKAHLEDFLRDENMCPFHKPQIQDKDDIITSKYTPFKEDFQMMWDECVEKGQYHNFDNWWNDLLKYKIEKK